MNYTIEDLRGKYVGVGTPECEVFLDACESLLLGPRFKMTRGMMIHIGEQGRICQDHVDYVEMKGLTPFTPKPAWTVYNNDKPLSELSDEQVGKLVKYDGEVESFDGKYWYEVEPDWSVKSTYRAKQKTERELFIESALTAYRDASLDDYSEYHELTIEQMTFAATILFNTGFKAPKGGE